MVSKALLIAAVIAYVEARFGQEQIPIADISAVQGGEPGAAATIAGAAVSDLLAAANACDKLVTADQIVDELGGGADAIAAAIGMVVAERNSNPFNGNVQLVCADPTLPVTPELRGITPKIDPAEDPTGDINALSDSSAANPLDAEGLSVFDLLDQAGFGDAVVAQLPGEAAAAAGGAEDNAGDNAGDNAEANAEDNAEANAEDNAEDNADDQNEEEAQAQEEELQCEDVEAEADNNQAEENAAANQEEDNNNQEEGNNQEGNNQEADNAADNADDAEGAADANAVAGAGQTSLTGGEDFGDCTPTITFQGGEGNRPADEFTFQIADPLARGGQGEALNPNIITNALCDQLTNVCGANDAAIAACEDAQAQVEAAGTRNKSTADLFNTLLGFEGFVTNPNGGPDDVAARRFARKFRA